jgi:hypothetical protein
MKTRILSVLSILLFISACNNTFEVGIEHSPTGTLEQVANPAEVQVPAATIVPTPATVSLPIPTIPAAAADQVKPDVPSSGQMVKIFVIAVEDNGQTGIPVGCGDSAVPVMVEIPPTQEVLKAALEALFSVKDEYYGQSGLYNALYQSDLQVESVSLDNNGKARVYLTGNLIMGGECDTPRVQAQVEQTVLQFPTVKDVVIFINGKPLSDVFSLKV